MFKGRHFDHSVILLCFRWYSAYNLSLQTGSGGANEHPERGLPNRD